MLVEKKNWWGRLVFRLLLTQISSFLGHGIHLYLYGVEEDNLVFTGENFMPLIRLERILIVVSK
jgi:hypothetical protein